MKLRIMIWSLVLVASAGVVLLAQEKAAVLTGQQEPFRAGGPVSFSVKLDEPMPKGAHFDFRISPLAADEEISLGSGEPVGGSEKEFRVSGKLPEAALPGEWHISVIYLFLPGAGWTHNTITPNDLKFKVEGNAYAIPTKATVALGR
jgi:hypothetical protein